LNGEEIMGLVRSEEEIKKRYKKYEKGYTLMDVKMVYALFTTTMEAVERLLPPPLKPADTLACTAFVAEYQKTDFISPYNEAAVFIPCQYKGETGRYCLAMPVTTDIAMIGGREVYGYPKKIAEKIFVTRTGNEVHGLCVRNGFPIIEIKGTLEGEIEGSDDPTPHFVIKSVLDEKAVGPRKDPLLLRQVNPSEFDKIEMGEGTLKFGESKYDYLHEIPVDQVMMINYMENGTILMPPGEVVAKLNADEYSPYHGIKYDWVP
jgi:acetoacetate decarboxylase